MCPFLGGRFLLKKKARGRKNPEWQQLERRESGPKRWADVPVIVARGWERLIFESIPVSFMWLDSGKRIVLLIRNARNLNLLVIFFVIAVLWERV